MMADLATHTLIPLDELSPLQLERLSYRCPLPSALSGPITLVGRGEVTRVRDEAHIHTWFPRTHNQPIVHIGSAASGASGASLASEGKPLRIAVVFCGRQSPGGHNVACGLADALAQTHPGSELLGAVGGTKGLFEHKTMVLTQELLANYRNQGGYHLLGRSVDRIRTVAERESALAAATALRLDGLVLIGGTYTNTDAAHLAEYFAEHGSTCSVVGVPASIDGDLTNMFVDTTLGFDTATKVYSQLVGNMATDGNSAKKYYYFIRLMGRAASHIALEVALQTHPNVVLLGEEMEARKMTLIDVVRDLADVVVQRAKKGKNFGVVIVPEGTISAIPEIRSLIAELNHLLSEGVTPEKMPERLTPWSSAVLAYLPPLIRSQLFLERESSGAIQLSQISTERLLAELVGEELSRRKAAGTYNGKYASICHFFGYQARSSLPSNFDCAYGESLGRTAAILVAERLNGYMATVRNLSRPVAEWEPTGVPLTAMLSVPAPGSALGMAYGMAMDKKSEVPAEAQGARPVINSANVDVHGGPFLQLKKQAVAWQLSEMYSNPGPIQFDGPIADHPTLTLQYERHDYLARITALRKGLDTIRDICRPGVSDGLLDAAVTGVRSLSHILEVMRERE